LLRPKNLRFSSRTNLIKTRCAAYEKRANAQIAHLVFADTKANAEKTKRAIFSQRSTEYDKLKLRKKYNAEKTNNIKL